MHNTKYVLTTVRNKNKSGYILSYSLTFSQPAAVLENKVY